MRCYCTSPENCTCDGVPGTLTEAEALLEMLKERKQLYGGDSVGRLISKVEREIKAMSQPSGRDVHLQRLTSGPVGDRWPEDDESDADSERETDDSTQDTDMLEDRAVWLSRLPRLCSDYSTVYTDRKVVRRQR